MKILLFYSIIKVRYVILDKFRKNWFKMDRIISYLYEMIKFIGIC